MHREFVIISAMINELAPILDTTWAEKAISFAPNNDTAGLEEIDNFYEQWICPEPAYKRANLNFYDVEINGHKGWAVHSGIGVANAAATTALVAELARPKTIIYSGTAGGLAPELPVGAVVLGNTYRYHSADATVFGYAPGQVPGMPKKYPLSPAWNSTLSSLQKPENQEYPELRAELEKLGLDSVKIVAGEIITGDSFITADNIGEIKKTFPRALATEMESAAAAQVCWKLDKDFLAVRCISDLCSPDGVDQYHINVHLAAATAAVTSKFLISSYLNR